MNGSKKSQTLPPRDPEIIRVEIKNLKFIRDHLIMDWRMDDSTVSHLKCYTSRMKELRKELKESLNLTAPDQMILNAKRYVIHRTWTAIQKGVTCPMIARLFGVPMNKSVCRDLNNRSTFLGKALFPGDVVLTLQEDGNYDLLKKGVLIEEYVPNPYNLW